MSESLRAAQALLAALHKDKPEERNELARRYAIAITEAEKLYAWIETWLYDTPQTRSNHGAAGN